MCKNLKKKGGEHRTMKNKMWKSAVALALAGTLCLQNIWIPSMMVEAAGVPGIFVDKMLDIFERKTCEMVISLSESAAESGYPNISKATAHVAEWTLMSAAEVAAVEAVELCEEILAELNQLEAKVNANDAAIAEALKEVQWMQGKNSLSAVKTSDIANPIKPLTGATEAFEKYVQTRIEFAEGKATQKAFDESLLNFLFVLSRFTDETPDANSFESLGAAVFTTQKVSNAFSEAIDTLVANLATSGVKDYNVMSTAMAYAYYYYPYSHQQYDFILTQVGYQLGVIMEVMLMYNEFLALQYNYLSQHVDIDTTEGKALFNNYNGWVNWFDQKMVTLSDNIVKMLDKEYQVSAKRALSIFDYMKPEDAKKTVLQGSYNESNFTYDAYKLMTNTDNSKKNVYYVYDYQNTKQWYSESKGEFLEEYYKITSPLSDGSNTFTIPSSSDAFKELFNTNAFGLNGGTIRNVLYDYDDSGKAYPLLSDVADYVATSSNRTGSEGALGNKTYYAEFQTIDVDEEFISMSAFKTKETKEDDSDSKVVIFTAQNEYSQNVSVKCSGMDGSDLSVQGNESNVTVNQGEEKPILSGEEITIRFKVPSECRNITLECRRTYDAFDAATGSVSSKIILDQKYLDYLAKDNEGYYSIQYHMPYSECTFVLDCSEFSYDENGRIMIGNYADLEAVAAQISNNPSLYASKSYILTSDITIPSGSVLKQIGTDQAPFTGIFDGQGYEIRNFKANMSGGKVGFIGVNKGTIKNVKFSNAEISGNVAGVAAGYSAGTIENVQVYDSVINSARQGGGICGIQNNGKIEMCSTDGKTVINGSCTDKEEHFATGGIVGKLEGTARVERCTNEAVVNHGAYHPLINSNYAGGITGVATGTNEMKLCMNKGNVTAKTDSENEVIGGICGASLGQLTINNCANLGNLKAEKTSSENYASYAGGILGMHSAQGSLAMIEHCYSAGTLQVAFGNTGGIISGAFSECEVNHCYFDKDKYSGSVKSTDAIIDKITVTNSEGKSTAQFASGEVAYLLNEKITDGTQVWYQSLDNKLTPDEYPIFMSNGKNTVYKSEGNNGYTNGILVLPGDVNGDGIVDTSDAQQIFNHFMGIVILTDSYAIEAADVNEDGTIDTSDAQMAFNIFMGI